MSFPAATQAVALARALLLDPPVLLMDEPTSSMDNTSEDLIKKALILSAIKRCCW
jgi:ATP-binding cassette subfamily C protein LapB